MGVLSAAIRSFALAGALVAASLAAPVPANSHPGFGGMHGGFHGFSGAHGGFHNVGGMGPMHTNWGGRVGGWGHGGWGQHNRNHNVNRNINRNFNLNFNFNRNVNRTFGHGHFHHGFRRFHGWRDAFGRWHWARTIVGFDVPLGDGGGYAEESYAGGYDYGGMPYDDRADDSAYGGSDYDDEYDRTYDRDDEARDRGCPCACDRDNRYGDGEDGCY